MHNTHTCVAAVVMETAPKVMLHNVTSKFYSYSKYFLVQSIVTPVLMAFAHILLAHLSRSLTGEVIG